MNSIDSAAKNLEKGADCSIMYSVTESDCPTTEFGGTQIATDQEKQSRGLTD